MLHAWAHSLWFGGGGGHAVLGVKPGLHANMTAACSAPVSPSGTLQWGLSFFP